MLRNLARPFSYLGQKLKGLFSMGSKVSPIVRDARNVADFVDIAPAGLRMSKGLRFQAGNAGQGFFNNMSDAIKYFKYPV